MMMTSTTLKIKNRKQKGQFKSRFGQDEWVMSLFSNNVHPDPSSLFFLDIGCFHPVAMNNTYALEMMGWKGISVDPFPHDFEASKRKMPVFPIALMPNEEIQEFVLAKELGGFKNFIVSEERENNKFVKNALVASLKPVAVDRFFHENCPSHINYLSINTNGSEYEILNAIPWNNFQIDAITVQHNFEEPKRSLIRTLLVEKLGFSFCLEMSSSHDGGCLVDFYFFQ